jgi:hypothetical protein
MQKLLQQLTNEHVLYPKNPEKMFALARQYDKMKQGAAAISFYIRTADIEENDEFLQYQCMLYAGKCYERQGHRTHTVFGFYQHAVSLMLDRPEAYFLISQEYAKKEDWHNTLIYARHGLKYSASISDDEILPDLDYTGSFTLQYLVAYANWKISGSVKAKLEFFDLKYNTELNDEYEEKVTTMLNQHTGYPDYIPYRKSDMAKYKFPFYGLDSIEENYSKHFQDMFVLSCHKGKRNGTYLEIGSGHPFTHNNTALLETKFNWKGISIDLNDSLSFQFGATRRNTVICMSALEVNYAELLEKHCFDNVIDYLQVDIDDLSYEVLQKIPFDEYKFGVITFEHDAYSGDELRRVSRKYLEEKGYKLVGKNIAYNLTNEYEDWYVHPDIIQIDPKMECEDKVNFVWDYMMEKR